jgi:hypothetical protein
MPAKTFLERGEELFRHCPALHDVVLFDVRGRAASLLAESPLLGRVKCLTLADWLTAQDARVLAASPWLAGVQSLRLWLGNNDDAKVVRTFAGSAGLPRLREAVLVQLHGGVQAGDQAEALAARADEAAGEFDRLRGEEVASVYRPFRRRFPLHGDVGYGILAGHLPGGRPALGLPGDQHAVLVVFDEGGEMAELRCEAPGCDGDDLEGRLRDRWGFRLGLIRVHEFATDPAVPGRRAPWFFTSPEQPPDEAVALCQWGYFDAVVLSAPDRPVEGYTPRKWRQELAGMHAWMEGGNCILDCWNDYWVAADGTICAS